MENYLADFQLLLDFILLGDNWIPIALLVFAIIGVIESLGNAFKAIFGRKETIVHHHGDNSNNNNKE